MSGSGGALLWCQLDAAFAVAACSAEFEALAGEPVVGKTWQAYFGDAPAEFTHGARWSTQLRTAGGAAHPLDALVLKSGAGCFVVLADRQLPGDWEALFRQAPDALVLVDATGTIRYANDQAGRLFKRPDGGLVGSAVDSLVPAALRDTHQKHRDGYAKDPHHRPMGKGQLLSAVDAEDNEFPVEISLAPMGTASERLFGATIRDVSGRLERERRVRALNVRLQRANGDLDAFAARAAHDLSAPLANMAMGLDMLRDALAAPSEDVLDLLSTVQESAHRMQEMVDGLLALGRFQGEATSFEDVTLDSVLSEVLDDLAELVSSSQGKIEVGTLGVACVDGTLFRSLLQNLISNALRYHRPGTPPLVTIDRQTQGATWTLTVSDNGRGIPEDRLESIFLPFERVHSDVAGSGIGLSLARRIVEAHHGEIHVTSTVGEGSRFELTFPVNPAAAASEV